MNCIGSGCSRPNPAAQVRKSINRLIILLAAFMSAGCSGGDQAADQQAVAGPGQVDAAVPARICYRNEYPFDAEPDREDVERLTLEIEGNRAVGEYSWLPAFKDKRIGQFEGSYDGQFVTAIYEYTQEGQSAVSTISIKVEPERVVVEGESPELGLNATISRAEC